MSRKGASGSDSKFFSTNKKGENHELRQELSHQSKDKKKDAVKKVIANMTVGKDVSMLFTDVVKCIHTGDTQLKKLVYLYLINYAKSNPDLAILAVNTFVKDAEEKSNPLIRALAVRTMGCIRVDRIVEYLCEPLRRCLRDEDPYVRKTAAICVAKLYDITADLVEEQGFLDMLRELICDSNPSVVANAVAALSEISESGGRNVFKITTSVLQKLLAALNECTEWGQIFILDSLAKYTPSDSREAEGIIERVTPRLQHANSAVVLSAIKVIMTYLEKVTNTEAVRTLSRKMAPPLVTLLSTEPEIQYVALRNINLIVQKRPAILAHEIKVFFCKYNDPIYVKMEKLEIIILLVTERNIEQVLLELKEYATEVDVDFVRKSVRAIGRCAIKLEDAAERCINVLLELIQTKVNYIVQEAIVVIKDIFRKYPNRYESIIATLCENLESLDEPEAKASMIWIIGEYAERIDNADELLQSFLDSFNDETAQVQLQLLTATVKLFLKRPTDTQDMVQRVLNMATEDSDNPDLRDRGYVYWRLLSSNPQAAKAVVLSEKPTINVDTFTLEPTLLDQLVANIATLSSVYHKPPEAFVVKSTVVDTRGDDREEREPSDEGEDDENDSEETSVAVHNEPIDLLDMGDMSISGGGGSSSSAPVSSPMPPASAGLVDIFGGPVSSPVASVQKQLLVSAEQGKGLEIQGIVVRREGKIFLDMDFENKSQVAVASLAIQLNKSTFGLMPIQNQFSFPAPINPGSKGSFSLAMGVNPNFVNAAVPPSDRVQAAMKNLSTNDVIYFEIPIDLHVLFGEDGEMDKGGFIARWKAIEESKEVYGVVNNVRSTNIEEIAQNLSSKNVFYIARRTVPENQEVVYFSLKTITNVVFLIELTFKGGVNGCKVCVKTDALPLAPLIQKSIEKLLLQ